MFAKVSLLGRLGGDPVMRYTPVGKPITNFSMATDRAWKDADGATQKRTTWWKVAVWGKMAEACNEYLKKGALVYIEGEITPDDSGNPRIWTNNAGEPKASYELNASTVKFLSTSNRDKKDNDEVEEPEANYPF